MTHPHAAPSTLGDPLAPARTEARPWTALTGALLIALVHAVSARTFPGAVACGPTLLVCGWLASRLGLWPASPRLRGLVAVGLGLVALALGIGHGSPSALAGALTALVLAPLAEELVYRGMIFEGLKRATGAACVVLTSTLLFALAHGERSGAVEVLAGGLVLSCVRWRTGALAPGLALHGLGNALWLL